MSTGKSLPNLRDTGSVGSFKQICTDRSGRSTLATGYSMASAAQLTGGLDAYSTEVMADSPLGYWKMDNAANPGEDSSGNGRDLTANGSLSVVADTDFPSGSAIDFSGSSQFLYAYASDPNILPLAITGDVTITLWIKADTFTGANFFCYGGESGSVGEERLYQGLAAGGSLILAIHEYSPTQSNSESFSVSMSTATRHHIALVRDNAALTWTCYVDGVQQGAAQAYAPSQAAAGGQSTAQRLKIATNDVVNGYYNGKMSGFSIFGSALSSSRIAAHYAAGIA